MHINELILLSVVSVMILLLFAREVQGFYRWKRSLKAVEKGGWSRIVRMIRED
ncbi:MAG: hypothetical protein ACRD7E_00760 [Bryobacteraceae bacterium]